MLFLIYGDKTLALKIYCANQFYLNKHFQKTTLQNTIA